MRVLSTSSLHLYVQIHPDDVTFYIALAVTRLRCKGTGVDMKFPNSHITIGEARTRPMADRIETSSS